MAIADVITAGFGTFSNVSYIPTRGFISSNLVAVFVPVDSVFIEQSAVQLDAFRFTVPAGLDGLIQSGNPTEDTRIVRHEERITQ